MFLRIQEIKELKLVGLSQEMSLDNNQTFALWKRFKENKNVINNRLSSDYISLQVYDSTLDFKDFTPNTIFTKKALVEVEDFSNKHEDFESYVLNAGLYAVFLDKGLAKEASKTFGYIFSEWLPKSKYQLDDRPHFEVLGEKYKNNDPNSEEEVFIPIRLKSQ